MIERKLGEGAYGRVYEATDERTERRVAIKVLKPDKKTKKYRGSRVKRFEREARAVASLEHPNVVTLFDFGKSQRGLLYTVSEFIDGDDLQVEMQRRGKFRPLDVVHVIEQIMSALREAHKAGIVHRDLKPANIRVYEYDDDPLCIKVLDFGLAWWEQEKDEQRLTREGSAVGTPRYMSPEQLRGEEATVASDFYAVGLIAFELLFGMHNRNLNFAADGRDVVVPEHDEIGLALRELIDRMLRFDVRERPKSASEILGRLAQARKELEAGEPPQKVGVDNPSYYRANVDPSLRLEERPRRRLPKWPLGVAVIATIALLSSFLMDDEPPPPPVVLPPDPAGEMPPPTPLLDLAFAEPATDRGCGKEPDFTKVGELSVLDGLDRHTWLTYIPESYDPNVKTPLIVLLHDVLEPPKIALMKSRLVEVAHEEGVILIVPPHGYRRRVDTYLESTEQLTKRIEWTRDALCIDESQIMVVAEGGARGAAYGLRCEPWVSAIGMINWGRRTGPLPYYDLCERQIPVISIANVEQKWSKRGPVPQEYLFAEHDCRGEPQEVLVDDTSFCNTWACDVPFESCFAGVEWFTPREEDDTAPMPMAKMPEMAGMAEMTAGMTGTGEVPEIGEMPGMQMPPMMPMGMPGMGFGRGIRPIVSFPVGRELWAFWQRVRPDSNDSPSARADAGGGEFAGADAGLR